VASDNDRHAATTRREKSQRSGCPTAAAAAEAAVGHTRALPHRLSHRGRTVTSPDAEAMLKGRTRLVTSQPIRLEPPDIVLLVAEWQPRVMIRAQLIEEGFDVVATNTWPMMRRHLRPGMKPRLAIVDLKGLPNPKDVLGDLRLLLEPHQVVVLTASGTVPAETVESAGFRRLSRPFAIRDVVTKAVEAVASTKDLDR
jgi:hypothetical protein